MLPALDISASPTAGADIRPPISAPTVEQALLDATRALLRIEGAGDARDIAVGLVTRLGGQVAPAQDGVEGSLHLDISFGAGPVVVPVAEPATVERMLLERHLPAFVEDAHRALSLVCSTDRLSQEASIDPLTGLANRRASGRALGRLREGDTVVLLDLDHFKLVNDERGHQEGDRVLRLFGRMLRDELLEQDHGARHGGEEFLLVLRATTTADAHAIVTRLYTTWRECRPFPVTFSAGIAAAGPGGSDVVAAADRALYRAKELGRNRVEIATTADHR